MSETNTKSFDGTSRDPVNKTAAIILSKGQRYKETVKIACAHFEVCPPLRKIPWNAPKLVGMRNGRLTVVGLYADGISAWVVRCDCGDYETRTAKAIRNPKNFGDRCVKCRKIASERASYEWLKTGIRPDERKL